MQTNPRQNGGSQKSAEEFILAELTAAPIGGATLRTRVQEHVGALSAKHFREVLNALVAARKIHERPKLAKNGKPTKTIESYALGEAPPPPPPRDLRKETPPAILAALQSGRPLAPADLKARVTSKVAGLSARDYTAILGELVSAKKIHARHSTGKNGKPTKTIAGYALGPPPAPDLGPFLAPLLQAWTKARAEVKAVGIAEETLTNALLQALQLNGVTLSNANTVIDPVKAQEEVLRNVRELVRREGAGALIPIRQLRAATRLAKSQFDAAVLQLHGDDTIILHHHDYIGSLSEAERADLVVDQYGNHYVGIALRGES